MNTPQIIGRGSGSLAGEYLASIRDFAMAKGINTQILLEGSDLALDNLLNPPARIGDVSMHQVCTNLINALDKPLEACVEFGRSMAISRHGVLGIAAQGASNLLQAAQLTAQFFSTRTSFRDIEIIHSPNHVALRLINSESTIPHGNADVRLFFDLSTMINIAHIGERLLNLPRPEFTALINVDCPEPADFPYHLLGESLQIQFDQAYFELCIPRRWMQLPLTTANSELAAAATSKCESELRELAPKDLLTEVRQRVLHNISDTPPTLDELAAQMFMSTSTLQRRLRAQQTSYQRLKAELRQAQAKKLLKADQLTIEKIAEQLGYSDASNFTKAFRNWTGETPKAFRQRLRQ